MSSLAVPTFSHVLKGEVQAVVAERVPVHSCTWHLGYDHPRLGVHDVTA
jgi:hypothetical protein